MAVYNTSGQIITNVYDASENRLTQAYDISENPIVIGAGVLLTVMTYNVGMWGYMNNQLALHQAIFDKYKPDIIGIQELGSSLPIKTVGQQALANFSVTPSDHKNYLGMATTEDYQIANLVKADFVNQDPADWTQYTETRAYMMADITVGNKTVRWINTHFCLTNEYKYLQMAEILALAKQREYVIVTGDFNAYNFESVEDNEYSQMWGIWYSNGFRCVNHQQDGSYTKTFCGAKTATSLADFTTPTDDIMVTSNIDVLSVTFDTTKLSYLNNQMIDHIPIVAQLAIRPVTD